MKRHIGGPVSGETRENERTRAMQTIQHGYRGLSLLMDLNWDRMLYVGTIALALFAGAFLGSTLG